MVSPIQYLPTGLIDVSSTVNNVMDQNNSEINSLDNQVSSYQTDISDFGQLSGSLAALQASAQAFTNASNTLDPTTMVNDITNFVNAYNSLQSMVNNLSNSGSDTNGTLSNLENSLQNTLNSSQSALGNSDYNGLAQIGITTQADGTLKIDSTTLNNAVNTDAANVQAIFTNNGNGVADQLNTQLQSYLQPGGVIASDTYSLNQNLSDLQNEQQQAAYGQSQQSDSLTNQYTALNLYLNTAQVDSTLLADQQQALLTNLQQSLLANQQSDPLGDNLINEIQT